MSNPGDYYGMAQSIADKDKRIEELQVQLVQKEKYIDQQQLVINDLNKFSTDEQIKYLQAQAAEAFKAGYAQGHNDTVEGCYCLDEDMKAKEYLQAIKGEGEGEGEGE